MAQRASIFFSYERRVQFGDTDMAEVAHFSRLLSFVEEAEHAALESMGIPVVSASHGWPRVRLEVEFLSPARYGEILHIHLSPARVGRSTLTWRFVVEGPGKRPIARGTSTACHVRRTPAGEFMGCPLPAQLTRQIRAPRKTIRPARPRPNKQTLTPPAP